MEIRKKNLTCACCGGHAPAFKQWYNRDTGYGVCKDCFKLISDEEGLEQAIQSYGHEGIHHSITENSKGAV